jgi:hypothetical protein
MRVRRLALVVALLAGLATPGQARAGIDLRFDRGSAVPNDRVTIRARGTPESQVRLYLLRRELADDVRSRLDRRLSFVGAIAGTAATFSVPPLDTGEYVLAYWCRTCAPSFAVRARAYLRIESTAACPVTLPNRSRPPGQPHKLPWYGNGLLWAGLSRDGIYAVSPDRVGADGSIGNKLLWATRTGSSKPGVSGERLDAPAAPLRVLGVNRGSFAGAERPSFMSAVTFPTAGCWRLTARLGDVSLTYVVSVIVR